MNSERRIVGAYINMCYRWSHYKEDNYHNLRDIYEKLKELPRDMIPATVEEDMLILTGEKGHKYNSDIFPYKELRFPFLSFLVTTTQEQLGLSKTEFTFLLDFVKENQ